MAAEGLRGANDKWTLRCRSTSVSASESLCGQWKNRATVLEVTPVELPTSDRLLGTQRPCRGRGGVEG